MQCTELWGGNEIRPFAGEPELHRRRVSSEFLVPVVTYFKEPETMNSKPPLLPLHILRRVKAVQHFFIASDEFRISAGVDGILQQASSSRAGIRRYEDIMGSWKQFSG